MDYARTTKVLLVDTQAGNNSFVSLRVTLRVDATAAQDARNSEISSACARYRDALQHVTTRDKYMTREWQT